MTMDDRYLSNSVIGIRLYRMSRFNKADTFDDTNNKNIDSPKRKELWEIPIEERLYKDSKKRTEIKEQNKTNYEKNQMNGFTLTSSIGKNYFKNIKSADNGLNKIY